MNTNIASNIAANEKVEKQVSSIKISSKKITRFFIVGDSTLSPFADTCFYPRYGYGTKISNYLDSSKIEVVNLAISGRSSKSFIQEENYKILKENIRAGDFLLIGFGHNDEKTEEARYTNPNGTKEQEGTFKHSLYHYYIELARSVGAQAILTTPIVRRPPKATDSFSGMFVHITEDVDGFPGGDYPEAIRELALETNTVLVDNTKSTYNLYCKIGREETLYLHAWLSDNPISVDNTHLNVYGASLLAYMLVKELSSKDKRFASFVLPEIAEPKKEDVLKQNPDYVITSYVPPIESERSDNFSKVSFPWWGTVFGDVGGKERIFNKDFFDISFTNGVCRIKAGTESEPAGKIAETNDGLAFCFMRLPNNKDFTLSADVEVKFIMSNNQVSFGLMVRDDVYIDKIDLALMSDFVAVGPLKIAKGKNFSTSFARLNNALVENKNQNAKVPCIGQTIHLELRKKGNTFIACYGDEPAKEYQTKLNTVDSANYYLGFFATRQSEVLFTNIKKISD